MPIFVSQVEENDEKTKQSQNENNTVHIRNDDDRGISVFYMG